MEGQVFKIYIYITKHLQIYIKKTRINNKGLKKIFYSSFFSPILILKLRTNSLSGERCSKVRLMTTQREKASR